MYNKLFTKILDSSIWLENNPTRIVWLTFLAAMDQDGFAAFASIKNLAHRAIVTLEDAEKAVEILEGEDLDSGDPDNNGRRIEKVPGGWIILNSQKYKDIVTSEIQREKIKERVRKHRQNKKVCNASVTVCNDLVTQSETDTETYSVKEKKIKKEKFVKPTLEEIKAYCLERSNHVDPSQFLDHYEANGWMRGKNPIRDWKACVRTWEKNSTSPSQTTNQQERTSWKPFNHELP